jgi:hypothetical protein
MQTQLRQPPNTTPAGITEGAIRIIAAAPEYDPATGRIR